MVDIAKAYRVCLYANRPYNLVHTGGKDLGRKARGSAGIISYHVLGWPY